MKPIILVPLVALVLVGGSAGAYLAVTSEGSVEEATVAQATPTPTSAAEPTPTTAPTQAPGGAGGGGLDLATVVPPPTPASADFTTYVDPVLGFSLQYPPDLAFTDLTGPISTGGLIQRAIEFRSPEDPSRAFGISVSANPKGLTLEQWAIEYAACRPKSIQQGMLGGIAAITCTREVIEGRPAPAVVADHSGRIFLISGTSGLTGSEFIQISGSFGF
jgi:hypothetical protein